MVPSWNFQEKSKTGLSRKELGTMRYIKAFIGENQPGLFRTYFYFALGAVMVLALTLPAQAEATAKGKTFTNKAVTIDLPPGWEIKPPPAGDKETIATFTSTEFPGTSVVALAYKGAFINYSYARIRMLKNAAGAYPGGQQQLKDEHKIKTENGLKAWLELWRGMPSVENKNIILQSPTAIFRSGSKRWVVLIGFTPESHGEWLEKEMLKMVNAAK